DRLQRAEAASRGADHDRHRTPALDDSRRRPDPRAGPRTRRRVWPPRRHRPHQRAVSAHVAAPCRGALPRRTADDRRADTGGAVRVLLAGIIARYPLGGVTWCSLMYLLGLRALGHEVFYIEDTGECIYDPEQNTRALDPSYGLRYIDAALRPFGLGDRWSFVNYDGSYHGGTRERVVDYARSADLFVNLSGGA